MAVFSLIGPAQRLTPLQWIFLLGAVGTLFAEGCASGSSPAAGGGSGGGDAATPTASGGAGGAVGSGGSGGVAIVDASVPADALETAASPPDAGRRDKVLIYGVTSGGAYRHASIPAAANAIARAAAAAGLTTEMVGVSDATNVVDRSKFTASALAEYGAVILLANDGEPFGYPATDEIQNLTDFVQSGGALVGIECVTDCYGGAVSGPMTGHPVSMPFHALLGANFQGHPGDFSRATCTKVGTHPSVAQLAATFNVTDEIYSFTDFRMDNQVVLNCVSSTAPGTVRPVSWFREEGSGRVFYTALGHPATSWTMPMDLNAASRLVEDHVLPGLLWSMRRSP